VSLDVSGSVGKVLATALDGISLRQRVIADNIANVDTPGFRATSVDFETSLRRAVDDGSAADGDMSGVSMDTQATDTPVGANGNNVDLRKETLAAVQSQYQYQVLSRAVSDRFALVRDSIGTQ
jgi:flagellar basal-body rod protein FlgB